MQTIRVAQMGLGPIGLEVLRLLLTKPQCDLVGATDINPDLIGKDIQEILHLPHPSGYVIKGSLEKSILDWKPQVLVHTTRSHLNQVEAELEYILKQGINIVSSTEELFYPYERDKGFCQRIDTLAKEHDVTIIGTGVNPGFAMDVLPLTLTSICTHVERLRISRVLDASNRRGPFQRKIGAGLTPDEFREKAATGHFGHIGLLESALMVMAHLNWPVDSISESLDPVIAKKPISTSVVNVKPGQVVGLHQTLRMISGGTTRLLMNLEMVVGAEDPHDSVDIEGSPPINNRIEGGIFGDTATVASLINTIPRVLAAPAGLLTMMDLPVPKVIN